MAIPVVPDAPSSNPVAELSQTGQLNYVVYRLNAGGTAIETTTVPGAVTNEIPSMPDTPAAGTLTLALSSDHLVVNTIDTWVNYIWPSTHKGVLSLRGNAGLVCDIASPVRTGQVGISHNMQAVTSLEQLKGLTFGGYDCATATPGGSSSYSFLPNGSLDADGDTVDAEDVAALFSEDGLDIEDLNLKLRAYRIQQDGQARYAAVLLFAETDPSTGVRSHGVELLLN